MLRIHTPPSVFGQRSKTDGTHHVHLDDWLIQADSPGEAERYSQEMVSSFDWLINQKKSELTPTQVFNFVGYQYDLSRALVRPTQDR